MLAHRRRVPGARMWSEAPVPGQVRQVLVTDADPQDNPTTTTSSAGGP